MTTAWKERKKKVNRCQGCRDDSSMAVKSDLERNGISHYSPRSTKRCNYITPHVTLLSDASTWEEQMGAVGSCDSTGKK